MRMFFIFRYLTELLNANKRFSLINISTSGKKEELIQEMGNNSDNKKGTINFSTSYKSGINVVLDEYRV